MKKLSRQLPAIVIGLIAIIAGVGYGLRALNVIDSFTLFFDGWWTVFIILPGLFTLFQRGSSKIVGLFLIVLGVCLFLAQQKWIDASFVALIFPALAILFGLWIIINAFTGKKSHGVTVICEPTGVSENGSLPVYDASFGELRPDFAGKVFEGCRVSIAFGKATLDLRQAMIESDCLLDIDAAFSGVEVFLPTDCRLDLDSSANFGSVENQFIPSGDPDARTIHVKVDDAFGGVVIR